MGHKAEKSFVDSVLIQHRHLVIFIGVGGATADEDEQIAKTSISKTLNP
jgi:uncharacterized protein GlcG (DUF336 family)